MLLIRLSDKQLCALGGERRTRHANNYGEGPLENPPAAARQWEDPGDDHCIQQCFC